MQVKIFLCGLIATCIFSPGCQGIGFNSKSNDPLTRYLDDHQFHAFNPPTSRATVGDLYADDRITDNKNKAPIALVSYTLEDDDREMLMARAKHDVSMPDVSGSATYILDAKTAILNNIDGELALKGVKKYRIRVKNPREYVLSQTEFRSKIEPRILEQMSGDTIGEKHYIYSLLEVDGIEYELLNEHGSQVELTPSDQLSEVISGSLGSEWQVSSDGKLVSTEPRFIGYKTHKIKLREDGIARCCSAPEEEKSKFWFWPFK